MSDATVAAPARNASLDGIRGCAALAIIVWHFIPSLATPQLGTPLAYLNRALGLTWIGVDVFFVLSGFLIGGILLRARGSPRYFKTFYGRRALRILPLYYLLLAIHAVARHVVPALWPVSALAWHFTAVPTWSFWLCLQNFFMPGADDFGNPLLGITWSLALEEQFYLLIPLLLHVTKPRLLPWLLLPAIAGAPLLRCALGPGLSAYVLLPSRLDGLLLGVLLAWILTDAGRTVQLARQRTKIVLGTVALALAVGVPALRSGANLHLVQQPWGWLLHTWVSVVTFGVIAAVQTAPAGAAVTRILGSAPLRWCGLRAYGLYLLHPWALHLSFAAWGVREPILTEHGGWAPLLAATFATFILAAASYRWLELPCMRLGQRLRY
jgi:peptidoglycan/LPS O-acetylase OafA/YrhL